MSLPRIELTPEMVDFADNIACCRQADAFKKGRKNRNNLVGGFDVMLGNHRLGARCELAAKRYLNPIEWHAYLEEVTDLPDLGDFIDVKAREKAHHKLIVQRDAKNGFAFLLVCARDHPVYEIAGWIMGVDAKQPKFWQDPVGGRAAYFVPKAELNKPETLLALVRKPVAA